MGDDPWKGYGGDDLPCHHPVFVLTCHPREPLEMLGGTTFHFVADGIEPTLEQARAAACGKDVSLDGGANVVQQYPAADLLDEMLISVVPVLLGGGAALRQPRRAEAQASADSGGRGTWSDARRYVREVAA